MSEKKVFQEMSRRRTEDTAIEVNDVTMMFRYYHDLNLSVKEKIINWRKRGWAPFYALKNVSFSIQKGDTISIIGPNGSGKSTLLRVITKILTPTSGHVETEGRIAALLELGAGFQPDLTGRENIYLNASILGINKRDVNKILQDIIDFSELGGFIDNQVKNYSSGMYVRLGFSIATNVDPDILLIDEVLAVGDESFQAKCLDRISRFQRDGKTIILVTHDVDTAAAISDRLIWLESGEIQIMGDPKKVSSAYHERMATIPVGEEFGTRDVYFTKIEILDSKGKPKSVFENGESIVLKLHYHAEKSVIDPVFGFGIYDKRGLMVYGTNTNLMKRRIEEVQGDGVAVFTVNELPMAEGVYYLSIAVHTVDGGTNYHWMDKMFRFEMRPNRSGSGFLDIDTGFSIA